MKSNLSKPRMVLMLAALFLSSMCTESDMVITPIVSSLYDVFSDSPTWLVNLGITGPAFIGLPFCLLGGWLADRYDKKKLMVAFFALFTVSSTLGAAVQNIYYFVFMRQLAAGVAWAVTNTVAFAIIADVFVDKKQHSMVVGFYGSATSCMGALLAMVAGMLATNGGWTSAFATYLISIPVLVLLIVSLPSLPAKAVAASPAAKAVAKADKGWWKRLMPLMCQAFFICICYFVLVFMPSVYITDSGIGNEAFTGIFASLVSIASGVGALFFGVVYMRMKKAVYLPAVFVMAAGFILMALFPSRAMALLAAVVVGLAWPFYFSYLMVRCTELVTPDKAGRATGLISVADGASAALSSYAVTGAMQVTGATSSVAIWPLFGIVLAAVGVVSVAWYLRRGRKLSVGLDPEVREMVAAQAARA